MVYVRAVCLGVEISPRVESGFPVVFDPIINVSVRFDADLQVLYLKIEGLQILNSWALPLWTDLILNQNAHGDIVGIQMLEALTFPALIWLQVKQDLPKVLQEAVEYFWNNYKIPEALPPEILYEKEAGT